MAGGAPTGNTNATKGKPWREAINHALKSHPRCKTDQAQALRDIATKLIDKALEGDLNAMKELGDRIEGKPQQSIDMTHDIGSRTIAELRGELDDLDTK